LNVSTEYFAADYKIMVFGQETNDWEGIFPHPKKTNHLLDIYHKFYNNGSCFSYSGSFWNGVSQLKSALRKKFGQSDQVQSILWNNVIKIGKANGKGTPSNEILKWQDTWFDIVLLEVCLLRPDIIVFFTGPNYDVFLSRIFSDLSFENLNGRDSRELARVKSHFLPRNTIRTYHPGFLWRNKFYSYLDEILDAIEC